MNELSELSSITTLSKPFAETHSQADLTMQVNSLMDKLRQLSVMLQAQPSIEASPITTNNQCINALVEVASEFVELSPKESEELLLVIDSLFHHHTQLMNKEQNKKIQMVKKLMRSCHDVLKRMEQRNILIAEKKLFLEGLFDILKKMHAESVNVIEKQTQELESSILSNHHSLVSRIETIAQGKFPGTKVSVQEQNHVITVTHIW